MRSQVEAKTEIWRTHFRHHRGELWISDLPIGARRQVVGANAASEADCGQQQSQRHLSTLPSHGFQTKSVAIDAINKCEILNVKRVYAMADNILSQLPPSNKHTHTHARGTTHNARRDAHTDLQLLVLRSQPSRTKVQTQLKSCSESQLSSQVAFWACALCWKPLSLTLTHTNARPLLHSQRDRLTHFTVVRLVLWAWGWEWKCLKKLRLFLLSFLILPFKARVNMCMAFPHLMLFQVHWKQTWQEQQHLATCICICMCVQMA